MSAAMNGAMDASNMGTALSNIYSSLMKGSGATANAQKAWASLGFTSEQVAKSMLEDSQGTMTEIFAAMNNLPAEQLSSTIGSIFGDNKSTKMAIASFTANLDKLEANFAAIGDATLYAGSMQDEFNARAETTENKIKLAENAINRLKIGIGDLLLPVVAKGANLFADAIEAIRQKIPALTEKLQGLQPTIDNLKRLFTVLSSAATSVGNTILSSFTGENVAAVDAFGSGLDVLISIVNSLTDGIAFVSEFVQSNWSVIGPIVMGITSALIAYKAAMIGVTVATKAALIIEALTKAWAVGSTLIAIFTSGAKAAAIAQWALNAAMTANPIGVVVVAIGALIVIIALLVMNWDTVKAKAIEVWQTILSTLGNIGTWFQGVFAQAQGAFQNFMGNLSERFPLLASIISVPIEAIKGYIAGLQQFLGGIIDFVTGVFTGNWQQAWQGIQDIFGGIFSGLGALVKAPLNAIISLVNKAIGGINSLSVSIPPGVPFVGGTTIGFNIPQIPMLAKGSSNSPDTFIAGEQGPELITGAAGSKVFTADQTSGIFNRLAQLPDMAMSKLSGAFSNLFNSPDNISRYDNLNGMQGDSSPLSLPSGSESYNSTSLEVNYSIGNITIQGGGENNSNIKQQIKDALRENTEEIVQLINDTIEGNEHRKLRLSNS